MSSSAMNMLYSDKNPAPLLAKKAPAYVNGINTKIIFTKGKVACLGLGSTPPRMLWYLCMGFPCTDCCLTICPVVLKAWRNVFLLGRALERMEDILVQTFPPNVTVCMEVMS